MLRSDIGGSRNPVRSSGTCGFRSPEFSLCNALRRLTQAAVQRIIAVDALSAVACSAKNCTRLTDYNTPGLDSFGAELWGRNYNFKAHSSQFRGDCRCWKCWRGGKRPPMSAQTSTTSLQTLQIRRQPLECSRRPSPGIAPKTAARSQTVSPTGAHLSFSNFSKKGRKERIYNLSSHARLIGDFLKDLELHATEKLILLRVLIGLRLGFTKPRKGFSAT